VDDAAQGPLEHDGRVAERTEGDHDGDAAHGVVRDLMPDEDLEGIGARVAVELESDDGLLRAQELVAAGQVQELGLVAGGRVIVDLADPPPQATNRNAPNASSEGSTQSRRRRRLAFMTPVPPPGAQPSAVLAPAQRPG
jgi:hypothetical protein